MNAEHPLIPQLAVQLESASRNYLLTGRGERDVTHSRTVAQYARLLGEAAIDEGNTTDLLVLTTTGYLHDIGYTGLLPVNYTISDVRNVREPHMRQGKLLAQKILNDPHIRPYYNQAQIERILHLIGMHDNYNDAHELDERIFIEADTLGALDVNRAGSRLNLDDSELYLLGISHGREWAFSTELGKLLLFELMEKRVTDILYQRSKQAQSQTVVVFEGQ